MGSGHSSALFVTVCILQLYYFFRDIGNRSESGNESNEVGFENSKIYYSSKKQLFCSFKGSILCLNYKYFRLLTSGFITCSWRQEQRVKIYSQQTRLNVGLIVILYFLGIFYTVTNTGKRFFFLFLLILYQIQNFLAFNIMSNLYRFGIIASLYYL